MDGRNTQELAEPTREAHEAFEDLDARLDSVAGLVEGGSVPQRVRYLAVTSKFRELVAKQSARNQVLQRLGQLRRLRTELRELHSDIDALGSERQGREAAASSAGGRAGDWETRVQASVNTQLAAFAAALDNGRLLVEEASGNNILETLTVLRYELQYHGHEMPARERELIERALAWAEQSHAVPNVPRNVPEWFIPSDEVQYVPSEFDIGSFGSVHRATWHGGQRVVVKKLLLDDVVARASFIREADVWWALRHEHVVRLIGASHVSSPLLFVCEEAAGGNFADFFVADRRMQHQLWRLFLQCARGLQYLHESKVVHGDLKCNNLLVSADGTAKICDFGFAYIRRESAGHLSAKPQADSVRWKAPECLLLEDEEALTPAKNPQFASDVYALGLCILEAFADEPPYGYLDDETIVEKILEGELPERPVQMRDDRAWELVQSMCAFEHEDRPAISDVIEQMEVFAEEEVQHPDRHYRPIDEQQPVKTKTFASAASDARLLPLSGRP